jgi:4-hydroxy-2-oxoglutarate aldolase
MTIRVQGVFPPVPTTFTPDGELDLDGFAANLRRLNQTGLSGYVVLGSNGEFPLLDESEKLAVFEKAREVTPADKLLICGTGVESTRNTIALTKKAAAIGADVAIVLTPHYFRPSYDNAAYLRHYLAIAEASPIPILVYNMPLYAVVDVSAELLIELSHHPNIVGYKESGQNIGKLAEVADRAEPHFSPLAGSTSNFLPALSVGAAGGVMALANIAPNECIELFRAGTGGDMTRARALQYRLLAPNNAVTTKYGVAGLKAALDLLGYVGGSPRLPATPLGEKERATLADVLASAGIRAMATA